jgi:2-hydroxychromene-2-carboxylate isomerase
MSVEVCSASTTRVLAFPIESEQVTVLDPGGSSKRFRGRAGDVDRFSKLRGDAELAVYIDLKSPYAFIAIEPTRAMAAALGVLIDWRPFTLDIPSYLGSARLDERGRVASSERTPQQWTGVRYAYRDARRYASLRGKTLRGTEKIWDSSLAGIAMLWAKQQGVEIFERFIDDAYARFWRRDLDIEDALVLEASLGRSGAEVDGFRAYATGAGRVAHDALNRDAFDAGVFGVPTYLVGDEMWFGREHLPRVAWLLGGRSGPAPDVANRAFGA